MVNKLGASQRGHTRGEKLGFSPLLRTLRGVDGISSSQRALHQTVTSQRGV